MLFGKRPMARLFLEANNAWNVNSADDIINDTVLKRSVSDLDKKVLPYDVAC